MSNGTVFSLSSCNLSTLDFKLFKLLRKVFNLSISNSSKSDFELAISFFLQIMYQQLLVIQVILERAVTQRGKKQDHVFFQLNYCSL